MDSTSSGSKPFAPSITVNVYPLTMPNHLDLSDDIYTARGRHLAKKYIKARYWNFVSTRSLAWKHQAPAQGHHTSLGTENVLVV